MRRVTKLYLNFAQNLQKNESMNLQLSFLKAVPFSSSVNIL